MNLGPRSLVFTCNNNEKPVFGFAERLAVWFLEHLPGSLPSGKAP